MHAIWVVSCFALLSWVGTRTQTHSVAERNGKESYDDNKPLRRASGLPQGGTHSCALWNGFIDIMAEMQHEMAQEKGVMVEDEWGR